MPDVERIVHLLGHVAGMEAPIADRRRRLMHGLCEMVGCSAWIWVHSRFDRDSGQSMLFSALDGGFSDEHQRQENYSILIDPRIQKLTAQRIVGWLVDNGRHITMDRPTMLPDELYGQPEFDRHREQSRYEPAAWSLYLVGPDVWSAIGVMVERGAPMPGDRERAILHLVMNQIDWLHRADTNVPANSTDLLELSAREREVLFLLMGGDSRKQIAGKLGISPNTVADYLKSIYKTFNVNSRGELLSKFISGGVPRSKLPQPAAV